MADGPSKKRVAAFTIAIGRVLGRSVQDIKTTATAALLRDYKVDSIPDVSEIVAAQRESYDGTGPKGLKGDDIPLGARILRLANALDALLAGRPPLGGNERRYYRAVPISEAKERIQLASGTAFDPKIVNAFLEMSDWLWAELIHDLPTLPGFDE